jgi:hypothetical protein
MYLLKILKHSYLLTFWVSLIVKPSPTTLRLRPSPNVRAHASHPYSTTGNIIVLHILIFKFLERSREDKKYLD